MKHKASDLKRRHIQTLIISTTVLVFSLFASMGGTIAWFVSNNNHSADISQFAIANRNASIKSIRLIKYCFAPDGFGGLDYTRPADPPVASFDFDFNRNQFGKNELVDDVLTWVPVNVMNLYDPLETEIIGTPLIDLHCNAVLEITFQSTEMSGEVELDAVAHKRDLGIELEEGDMLLSSCLDFDLFAPDEIELPETGGESNPFYDDESDTYDAYIPDDVDYTPTGDEELYYKISYLSHLVGEDEGHANFYDGDEDAVSIRPDANVDFEEVEIGEPYEAVAYINVNYAPSELEEYKERVDSEHRFRAFCDYYLSLQLI